MTERKRVLEEFFQEEEIQYFTKIAETGLFLTGVGNILLGIILNSMKGSQITFASGGFVAGALLIGSAFGLNMLRRWNQ